MLEANTHIDHKHIHINHDNEKCISIENYKSHQICRTQTGSVKNAKAVW